VHITLIIVLIMTDGTLKPAIDIQNDFKMPTLLSTKVLIAGHKNNYQIQSPVAIEVSRCQRRWVVAALKLYPIRGESGIRYVFFVSKSVNLLSIC